MWLFILIIILTSISGSIIKLSLFERQLNSTLVILAVIAVVLAISPLGMRLNTQDVENFINNINTLTSLCTLMTAEALVLLLLIAHMLRYHIEKNCNIIFRIIFFLPSPVLVFSLFMPLVFCYNNINGHNYSSITTIYLISAAVLIFILSTLIRFCFHSFQGRLDIVLVMTFIQLIVAMFMPIAVNGMIFNTISEQGYLSKLIISIGCLVTISLMAIILRKNIFRFLGEPQI